MPLRNFGLSFSRARTNAGVTWQVVAGLLLALIVLVALGAILAG